MNEGYTIEQVAEKTGVGRHALRYYERIGVLAPVARTASGHRRYSDDDVGAVGFVTLLRDTGMPIRDITRFMELARGGDTTVPDRVELLHTHRDAVREHLDQQERYFSAIEAKLRFYRSLLPQDPDQEE